MKFAEQGYRIAAGPAVASVVLAILVGPLWGLAGLAVAAALLAFFRDPERTVPDEPGAVIAPADGRVCAVTDDGKLHRFDETATRRVSIFMSPLDVHINRMPVDGTVERVEHKPGNFGAAYSDEASDSNESNSLLVRAADGSRLVVVQIAGWLARRIVCYIDEQAALARGERFGLIMFSSRVDVYLPADYEVAVAVGDRTTAGETVIARSAAEAPRGA